MVYHVRGPTRRMFLSFFLWLGLCLGAGCASDPEIQEFDEAVEGEETSEQADSYDNLDVEQAVQSDSENYNYDNMAVGEGNNIEGLEENLAEDSYNVDGEEGYGYDENQSDSQDYTYVDSDNTDIDYSDNTTSSEYGNQYADVQNENFEDVLSEPVDAGYGQGTNMLSENTYGDAINSYDNSTQAIAALDAESESLATIQDSGTYDGMDMSASSSVYSQVGLPEAGSKMNYLVRQGDTLGTIAATIYGDESKWEEIQQLTGLSDPNQIYPGDVVYYMLTEQTQAFAAAYENTSKGEVTVSQGDTLSLLAQSVYGDQSQWKTIWRANDTIDDPDMLTVGQTVYFVDYQSVMASQQSWQDYFAQLKSLDEPALHDSVAAESDHADHAQMFSFAQSQFHEYISDLSPLTVSSSLSDQHHNTRESFVRRDDFVINRSLALCHHQV